jgi:lysyl-tRNA synthetase class 1
MIWVDREAKKIKERNLQQEWVDDMKTPSGRIHVGSLRGVLIHDLLYKALKEQGVKTHFSYVFNNMDPMDGLPTYLEKAKWEKYMGMPLYKIPSPEKGYENFAHYYASEFIDVFRSINCQPEIIWSSELYKSGKMNAVIKLFLDEAEKVRDIYKRIAKAERSPNWYPYNPICQKCGKIGTTNVYKWDGTYVYYRCEFHLVDWTTGCGYEGKVEPANENGKLPWKLDWPAHWKVIGVTVETSGKDHMSSGGSYDMATHFCREILKTEPPYAMNGYEWFTIGGRKMSSSKGIGASAKEASAILPPEVFRFLLVRTHIETHLDFNPFGDTILNLFDDYDRCMNAYFLKLENKLPKEKQGEVMSDFARIIELSEVRPHPKERIMLPRFRTIANLLKNKTDIFDFFEKQKASKLTKEEKEVLDERIKYAKLYLENYAEEKTENKKQFTLSENQKLFLKLLKEALEKMDNPAGEQIQNVIFSILKENNLKAKEVFQGFYQVLTGKDFGPKAADLIIQLSIKKVLEKLRFNAI